jgi:prophage regulatory protein
MQASAPKSGRPRLLRLTEVMSQVALGKSSLYAKVKEGTFPAPLKLGRITCWNSDAIDVWIADRIKESAK